MATQKASSVALHAVRLLTLPEAARLTSTSPAYWRRLAQQGRIPTVRLGRARRVRVEDLEAVCRLGL